MVVVSVVLFGEPGGGKSTLCNTLIGDISGTTFPESDEGEAETQITAGHSGHFGQQETFLIDTPGYGEASGDAEHMVQMARYIKEHEDVRAFVIALDFRHYRLEGPERRLFSLLASMYPGSKWYQHVAVVWTHYSSYIPKKEEQRVKRSNSFKRFILKYFTEVPANQVDSIPQHFVDSIEAREEGTPSASELSTFLGWAGQLQTLHDELPKPRVPVGEPTKEQTTETQSTSTTRTIIKKERTVQEMSDGTKEYGEWYVVSTTTQEFPIRTERVSETKNEKNSKTFLTKERTYQLMPDGSTRYGEWKVVESKTEHFLPPITIEKTTEVQEDSESKTVIEKERECEHTPDGVKYGPWKVVSTTTERFPPVTTFEQREQTTPVVRQNRITGQNRITTQVRLVQTKRDGTKEYGEWRDVSSRYVPRPKPKPRY